MAKQLGVALIHGAWHCPAHFQNIIDKLQAEGYQVEVPALPSVSSTPIEDAFAKDIATAKNSFHEIADSGKDVVVVSHSYGGQVSSEAVAEFIEETKGKQGIGRIAHLFFVAALILPKRTSLVGDNNTSHINDLDDEGLLHNLQPHYRFYEQLSTKEARKAMNMLKPQVFNAFVTETNYCGWADYGIPVTYLACTLDKALFYDPDHLKFMKRVEDAGVKDFTRHKLDTDHSPWLSRKKEFMEILSQVLEKASGSS